MPCLRYLRGGYEFQAREWLIRLLIASRFRSRRGGLVSVPASICNTVRKSAQGLIDRPHQIQEGAIKLCSETSPS